VPKAKAMLLDAEQWRKDKKVDEIARCVVHSLFFSPYNVLCWVGGRFRSLAKSDLSIFGYRTFEFTEKVEVDRYYPQYYHKVDKVRMNKFLSPSFILPLPREQELTAFYFGRRQDGRPVYVERLGKLDIKALYAATTQERLLDRLISEYERSLATRMPASSREVGHPVETFCTIMDLQGVSLSNFYRVKDYVMEAASIGQNRYPEIMGKFYIINAPWAFSAVWSIIKVWLDEVTVNKIDIIGAAYKDKLLAQIPAENLPKEFGGTCECVGGCSLSDAGPWNGHVEKEQEKEQMETDTEMGAPVEETPTPE
jgi:hypothetical protein